MSCSEMPVNDEASILCSYGLECNLDSYVSLKEKEIINNLKQNKTIYEVIYNVPFIKPYIDLDMDCNFTDDEVIEVFNNIRKTLKSKISYVFGGYTSVDSIHEKYEFIELKDVDETHKKLSLRIFAHEYSIQINKALGFWLEYVGLNEDLITKKIIDPSVYKSLAKQQKLRLLQSNKTKEDNKGVKYYYRYDKEENKVIGIKKFQFKYLAATYTKDTNVLYECMNFTDNETIKNRFKKNGKKDNKDDKQNKNTNNKTNNDNEEDDITPLLDEETLLKLLKLFPTDYEYIEQIVSNLCHSPYPIDVIKRVCYKWYNSIEHVHGDRTADYIDTYYEYTKSNKWFYSIINNYYEPQTIKDFGWTDEDEKLYNKLAFKTNKTLSQNQRKQKEEIKDKYVEVNEKLKESLTDEDKEKYKTRKHFVNLFRDLKRIITPYSENSSYYNMLFIDRKHNAYMLNERNNLEQINDSNFNKIIAQHKINENNLTTIGSVEKYNYIRKYNDVFVQDEYKEKVEQSLNIFKSGFVNEYDYMYYMRWLSMKLNNPDYVIKKNIVCVNGTSSFKSRFVGAFTDFMKITNIDYAETASSFNEWSNSAIVVIDEIPSKAKECADFQNRIKRMTGSDYVKINRKFEHENTIKACTNYIINSNYPECGGLFNNQKQNEMFRRFRVINKKTINKDDGNILCDNLEDKYILYNLYNYIKTEFKPMTVKEIQDESEFEKEYITKIKNTDDNKKILPRCVLNECVDDRKRLKIKKLVDYLKDGNYTTTIAAEKSYLLFNDICKVNSDRNLSIVDMDKFESIYLNEEYNDDNKKEEIEETI